MEHYIREQVRRHQPIDESEFSHSSSSLEELLTEVVVEEILIPAIESSNWKTLKKFRKFEFNDDQEQRLLLAATAVGNKKIIRYLYRYGIDDFSQALPLARELGDKKLVKYFEKRS